MSVLPEPMAENGYLADHVDLLQRSLRHWSGRDLIEVDGSLADAAKRVWEAPFVVLSHGTGPDPILTYGNRMALELFELSWDELTRLPSRLTAEAPEREERARLLARVRDRGYIDDYTGIRVSRSGRRFRIEAATVWNLIEPNGMVVGQAATFDTWRDL